MLIDALDVPYDAVEGEAAFYGPKIDVQIADAAGRESTLSTVQVDFHQPSGSTSTTSGRTAPDIVRSWSTAASSAAWNAADRGSLGARVREARLAPYQAVIGAKEAAAGHVALRLRDGRRFDPCPVGEVPAVISGQVNAHSGQLTR